MLLWIEITLSSMTALIILVMLLIIFLDGSLWLMLLSNLCGLPVIYIQYKGQLICQ